MSRWQLGTFLLTAHHWEIAIPPHIKRKKAIIPIAHRRRAAGDMCIGDGFYTIETPPLKETVLVRLEPRPPMRKFFASALAISLFTCGLFAFTQPAEAATHAVPVTPQTIAAYATVIRHINPEMPKWQSRDFARRVIVNAERWRLDANILVAIVTVESAWHTHAVSSAG